MPPESTLSAAIVSALTAGNGRSNRVGSEDELIQRLTEDGVNFDIAELFVVLGSLISHGRVERQPGLGLWLASGANVVRGHPDTEEPLSAWEYAARWGPTRID